MTEIYPTFMVDYFCAAVEFVEVDRNDWDLNTLSL
eukprot:COSAG02_NODE_57743_length_279_cov_1.200000_1_plen_34_part_10